MPDTIISRAKKLAVLQDKVALLQEQVDSDRAKALSTLHEQYGFADADELIKAIRAAAGSHRGHRPGRSAKKAGGHKKHARITAAIKAEIKAALQAGKTGGEVAAKYGVSLPSVYNIKKAFGLVKARKAPKSKRQAKAKRTKKEASKPAASEEKSPAAT